MSQQTIQELCQLLDSHMPKNKIYKHQNDVGGFYKIIDLSNFCSRSDDV